MATHSVVEWTEDERSCSALVVRIAKGDEDALTHLSDNTNRMVYGLALRILGESSSAEDVITLAPGIANEAHYQDSERKYNTSSVRMELGAHYPSHRHARIEELFVPSGDLHVEGQIMHAEITAVPSQAPFTGRPIPTPVACSCCWPRKRMSFSLRTLLNSSRNDARGGPILRTAIPYIRRNPNVAVRRS